MKKILCCALLTGALLISGCSSKSNNLANKYYYVDSTMYLDTALDEINYDGNCNHFYSHYITYDYAFTFFEDGLVSHSSPSTYSTGVYIRVDGEPVTSWKLQEDGTLFLFDADGNSKTYQRVDSIKDYMALDRDEERSHYFYNGKVLILQRDVFSTAPESLTPKDFGITKACTN